MKFRAHFEVNGSVATQGIKTDPHNSVKLNIGQHFNLLVLAVSYLLDPVVIVRSSHLQFSSLFLGCQEFSSKSMTAVLSA